MFERDFWGIVFLGKVKKKEPHQHEQIYSRVNKFSPLGQDLLLYGSRKESRIVCALLAIPIILFIEDFDGQN